MTVGPTEIAGMPEQAREQLFGAELSVVPIEPASMSRQILHPNATEPFK
jgi:hypothetical protein